MHKKIKISILVMLLILLCTLFNGCMNHIKTISVNNEDYFNALKCDNDEYNLVISESSAVDNLNNGYAAQADELLAKSLMDSGGHYYWYPHYITTIVIAVDTGKVKENINSFNSLAGVEEKIYIDSDYYNYITASIGYSLKKENYRLDDAINYLKEMERNGRLSNSNTELPIWICTDTQAVKLKRGNKNIDIIIPNDGTLSFVQGILSPYPLCFENNLCNNISQNDLRTYNNASPLYPTQEKYSNAVIYTDYRHFNEQSTNVIKKMRRTVFEQRRYSTADGQEHILSAVFFITLTVLWIAVLGLRVINKRVKLSFIIIGSMLILWLTARCIKWQINSPMIERQLWYSYYLFQFGIATGLLYLTSVTDKPSSNKIIPLRILPFIVVELFLLCLIYTNDYHQLAFSFYNGIENGSSEYTYGIVYYLSMLCIGLQTFIVLLWLIVRSIKSPNKLNIFYPVTFFLLIFLYTVAYVMRLPFAFESDMTVVITFIILAFMEVCLRSSLIPTNTKYKNLFKNSPLKMEILNNYFEKEITANFDYCLTDKQKDSIINGKNPIKLDENTLLFSKKISGGYVVWQDDISQLNKMYSNTKTTVEKLRATNALIRKEEKARRKYLQNEEKIDICNSLESEISDKLKLLSRLPEKMKNQNNNSLLTVKAALLLCYIKRRCNMFFIALEEKYFSSDELSMYIDELGSFAEYSKVKLLCTNNGNKKLDIEHANLMYEFMYNILDEATQTKCEYIFAHIEISDKEISIKVISSTKINSNIFDKKFMISLEKPGGKIIEQNDDDNLGIWLLLKGGEKQ